MRFYAVFCALLVAGTGCSASANEVGGLRAEAVLGWDKPDRWSSGLLYGVGGGYDFALGETLALGIDAEISGTSSGVDFRVFYQDSTEEVIARGSVGRNIFFGARLTGKVADRVAAYARAGYANVELKVKPEGNSGLISAFSEKLGGWRLGVGAQYLFGKAYAGLEYRYSDYSAGVLAGDSLSRHQLVGALGYRF